MSTLTARSLYPAEAARFGIFDGHQQVAVAHARHLPGVGLCLVADAATYRPTEPLGPAGTDTPVVAVTPERQPGHVIDAGAGRYFVASRDSAPGAWWLVEADTCGCPAGQRWTKHDHHHSPSPHRPCWHIVQVRLFVNALALANARPVARPNVSALVD